MQFLKLAWSQDLKLSYTPPTTVSTVAPYRRALTLQPPLIFIRFTLSRIGAIALLCAKLAAEGQH